MDDMLDVDCMDIPLGDLRDLAEKLVLAKLVVGVWVVQANHPFVGKENVPRDESFSASS